MSEYTVPASILISFIVLFFTHYKAVMLGFKLGSQADFNKVQSAEKPTKSDTVYEPGPSELDKEALDYE